MLLDDAVKSNTRGTQWLRQQPMEGPPLTLKGISLRPEPALAARTGVAGAFQRGSKSLSNKASLKVPDRLRTAEQNIRRALGHTDAKIADLLGELLQDRPQAADIEAAILATYEVMNPLLERCELTQEEVLATRLAKHLAQIDDLAQLVGLSASVEQFAAQDAQDVKGRAKFSALAQSRNLVGTAVQKELQARLEAEGYPGLKLSLHLCARHSRSSPREQGAQAARKVYVEALAAAEVLLGKYRQKSDRFTAVDTLNALLMDMQPADVTVILESLQINDLLLIMSRSKVPHRALHDMAQGVIAGAADKALANFLGSFEVLEQRLNLPADAASPSSGQADLAQALCGAANAFHDYEAACKLLPRPVAAEHAKTAKQLYLMLQDVRGAGRLVLAELSDVEVRELSLSYERLDMALQVSRSLGASTLQDEIAGRKHVAQARYGEHLLNVLRALQQGALAGSQAAFQSLKRATDEIPAIRKRFEDLNGYAMSKEKEADFVDELRRQAMEGLQADVLTAAGEVNDADVAKLLEALEKVATAFPRDTMQTSLQMLRNVVELSYLRLALKANSATQDAGSFVDPESAHDDVVLDATINEVQAEAFLRSAWRAEGIGIEEGLQGDFYIVSGATSEAVRHVLQRGLMEAKRKSLVMNLDGGGSIAQALLPEIGRGRYVGLDAGGNRAQFAAVGSRTRPQQAQDWRDWLRQHMGVNDAQLLTVSHIVNKGGFEGINSGTARTSFFRLPNGQYGRPLPENNEVYSEFRTGANGSVIVKCVQDMRPLWRFQVGVGAHAKMVALEQGSYAHIEFEVEIDAAGQMMKIDPGRHKLVMDYSAKPSEWAEKYGQSFAEPHDIEDIFGPDADPMVYEAMLEVAKQRHSEENLVFVNALHAFNAVSDEATAFSRADELVRKYFTKRGAAVRMDLESELDDVTPANISDPLLAKTLADLAHVRKHGVAGSIHAQLCDVFKPALDEVTKLVMTNDLLLFKTYLKNRKEAELKRKEEAKRD